MSRISSANVKRIPWSLEDPAAAVSNHAARLDVFRRVRDEIRELLTRFLVDALHL